jgi:VirK protein
MRKSFYALTLILMLPFVNLFAEVIHSYEELVSAMHSGKQFVIILDLEQVAGKPGMPTGSFQPKSMMLMHDRLMTSDLHFSDHQGSPRYEYLKFTFKQDNSVVIQFTMYDAPTFTQVGSTQSFEGSIGKGIEIFWSAAA